MKVKKTNKLVFFGTGNFYLNANVIQINPGPELLIKQKGDKMRKIISSALVVITLTVLMAGPSQAYWKKQWGNVYWCNQYHQCV